jgi:hypothetical protein
VGFEHPPPGIVELDALCVRFHSVRAVRLAAGTEVIGNPDECGLDDFSIGVTPMSSDQGNTLLRLEVHDRIGSTWEKL